jgi:ubiquinone/menaquinone biosynthesis C-methylase UbiE
MTRLNAVELSAMNNPLRRLVQRRLELPTFARMIADAGIRLENSRILDAGCGSGYSTELIAERFSPRELVAFDLMPEQIERAKRRHVRAARFRIGSITEIDHPDDTFDAAFVFGVLHHVPNWRRALSELCRVLVAGGVLLVEELHGRFVDFEDRFLFTSHPLEARFDWPTFHGAIERAGLLLVDERSLAGWAAHSFLCQKPSAAA